MIGAEGGGSVGTDASRMNFPVVEFWLSPVQNLLLTTNLLFVAPCREGLARWVYTTHDRLPPELRASLGFVCGFHQVSSSFHDWLVDRPVDDPLHRDIPTFLDSLDAFTEEDFQRFFRTGYEAQLRLVLKDRGEVSSGVPRDIGAIRDLLSSFIVIEEVLDAAMAVVRDPVDLKERFVSGVVDFWERYYRPEFEQNLPILERSVAYHRRRNYTGNFAEVFVNVAGRAMPQEFEEGMKLERLIFVPSCHVGPFLLSYTLEAFRSATVFLYNACLTGMRRT